MPPPPPPPLGELQGMTWDTARRRYFPTPKEPKPSSPLVRPDNPRLRSESNAASGSYIEDKAKRRRITSTPSKYRRRERGYGIQDRGSLSNAEQLAGLEYEGSEGTEGSCTCHSNRITTLQNFAGGTFIAATAGGKVIMQDHEGTTHQLGICSEPLMGLHLDVARMTVMAIAGGDAPHIHYFRRDNDNVDQLEVTTFDLQELDRKDVSCVASYDDVCVLGSARMLTTVVNYEKPSVITRKLPSDPLALEFGRDPNIVYVGMRNSSVLLADLRTPTTSPGVICRMPKGKAVVGVKKLDDGAVPFGLVASAMGSELLIYDTRFGKSPLHTLPDHINTYHAGLDLALTPDSRFLFASGSDQRIGLWSTITGERIHPSIDDLEPTTSNTNPLRRKFPSLVQKLSVRDDYGLDVACGGEVTHYGKPGGGRTRRVCREVEQDSEGSDSDMDM